MDRSALAYRPCVGIFLLNKDKQVWIGKRDQRLLTDAHLYEKKHLWQLPQGGIDEDESPRDALTRELLEETGIQNFMVLAEHPNWLSYELPDHLIGKALKGNFRGQKQKWFAAQFLGDDKEINLHTHCEPEFTQWRWCAPQELLDLVVPFKHDIYKKVLEGFKALL